MSIIYETAGKAREYRELAANLFSGCDHGCVYCYAPLATRKDRRQFHKVVTVRKNILQELAKDAQKYRLACENRQVLLCFTCDPYCLAEEETQVTRNAIDILHNHGLNVCVLTKGGTRSLRDIDLFTKADSYACTLTSLDYAISRCWEPHAAAPLDRIAALMAFHNVGVPTWVSLEPVLDPVIVENIVNYTSPWVDEYKIGVLNYHPYAKSIDWRKFAFDVVALLQKLGKKYYLKQDLLKWAPELAPQHSV